MKAFQNHKKSFLFLRYLNFSSDIFGPVGKRLHEKAKANFKIFEVINWEANNFNKLIAQIIKK